MFQLYNANPKGKKAGDCVIRAFSLALNKSWDDTYTELCQLGMKMKAMPNDTVTYTKYAKDNNMEKCKVLLEDGKKPTVAQFAKINKTGTFVLRVANHLVTVKDGKYHDTWDSGSKSIYTYWRIK